MVLKYQIGVDAGGTHSIAIAYDMNTKELNRVKEGPGQINTDSSKIGNLPTRAIKDSLLALYNGLEGSDGALVIVLELVLCLMAYKMVI